MKIIIVIVVIRFRFRARKHSKKLHADALEFTRRDHSSRQGSRENLLENGTETAVETRSLTDLGFRRGGQPRRKTVSRIDRGFSLAAGKSGAADRSLHVCVYVYATRVRAREINYVAHARARANLHITKIKKFRDFNSARRDEF